MFRRPKHSTIESVAPREEKVALKEEKKRD